MISTNLNSVLSYYYGWWLRVTHSLDKMQLFKKLTPPSWRRTGPKDRPPAAGPAGPGPERLRRGSRSPCCSLCRSWRSPGTRSLCRSRSGASGPGSLCTHSRPLWRSCKPTDRPASHWSPENLLWNLPETSSGLHPPLLPWWSPHCPALPSPIHLVNTRQ